jgi:hypothetical protein
MGRYGIAMTQGDAIEAGADSRKHRLLRAGDPRAELSSWSTSMDGGGGTNTARPRVSRRVPPAQDSQVSGENY